MVRVRRNLQQFRVLLLEKQHLILLLVGQLVVPAVDQHEIINFLEVQGLRAQGLKTLGLVLGLIVHSY